MVWVLRKQSSLGFWWYESGANIRLLCLSVVRPCWWFRNNDLSFDLSVYAEDTDGDISASKPLTVTILMMSNPMQSARSASQSLLQERLPQRHLMWCPAKCWWARQSLSLCMTTRLKQPWYNRHGWARIQHSLKVPLFVNLEGDVRFEPNRNPIIRVVTSLRPLRDIGR